MEPLSDEELRHRIDTLKRHNGNKAAAARELGIDRASLKWSLRKAERRRIGLNPGELPRTHAVGKITVQRDLKTGQPIQEWVRYEIDQEAREAMMAAAITGFASELPRAEPVNSNLVGRAELCSQYTITDYHFGLLSWREETGADWDLKIAEKLWVDWFAAAIRQSPDAHTAILAQLGDLLHFDSLKAITPAHGHVLDADSRFAKIVRVVIRCLRHAVRALLEKHEHVH